MPYPGMEKPEIRYNIFEPVLTSRFRLQHLYSWRFFRSRGKIMTCLEELYTGNGVALTKSDVLYGRLGYCVCYYVNCISLNMRTRCYVIYLLRRFYKILQVNFMIKTVTKRLFINVLHFAALHRQ